MSKPAVPKLAVPKLAVIVPVLNEQETIQALLQQIQAQNHDNTVEIVIVDGDRQGSTLATLTALPPWVKTMVSDPGRGHQMNVGARSTSAEILLFLHSDIQLPDQVLSQIESLMNNPKIQGGAFDFEILSPKWTLKWIGRISSWRSRLTRIPYGDQCIFIRRSAFEAVEGYPEIPIMEDVALMRLLKARRNQIRFLRPPVGVSDRRWEQEGLVFCTLRNWILLLLYLGGMSPHRLLKWYKPQQNLQYSEADVSSTV